MYFASGPGIPLFALKKILQFTILLISKCYPSLTKVLMKHTASSRLESNCEDDGVMDSAVKAVWQMFPSRISSYPSGHDDTPSSPKIYCGSGAQYNEIDKIRTRVNTHLKYYLILSPDLRNIWTWLKVRLKTEILHFWTMQYLRSKIGDSKVVQMRFFLILCTKYNV